MSQRGQTSVEYLGILVVVGLLIAGLLRGVEPAIAAMPDEVRCLISFGEDCADGASPPATPAPDVEEPRARYAADQDEGPSEGPPLGDAAEVPIPGLPWDGSVSVEGDDKGAGDFEGLYAEVSVTAEQRPCRYDADGRPTVTLSVSGEPKLGTKVGGERGGTAGSLDAYVGQTLTYEINTDPATAEDIRNGAEPPSPVDPTSIPPGTSIILNEDTYAGLDLTASYHAMRTSLGFREGRRVSSAVERVDEDTVRVTVGDADLVAEAISLGLGTDAVNIGLSAKSELTAGETRQVDIDISTPAGREAYANFVATGLLPDPGSSGVSDASRSEVISYESSRELDAQLGPFRATVFAGDSAGQIIDTTNADGTHTMTQFARDNEVSFTRTIQTDAAGNPVGEEQYVLRMQDVAGNYIDGFHQSRGEEHNPDIATQDMTMSFTGEDFEEMQRDAVDQLVELNPDLSRADIVGMLEEYGANATLNGDFTLKSIAAASEPAEVAQALLLEAKGSGTTLADYLLKFEWALGEEDLLLPPPGLGGPGC